MARVFKTSSGCVRVVATAPLDKNKRAWLIKYVIRDSPVQKLLKL